jgi:hypothetical protein
LNVVQVSAPLLRELCVVAELCVAVVKVFSTSLIFVNIRRRRLNLRANLSTESDRELSASRGSVSFGNEGRVRVCRVREFVAPR